ncbi:MAG: hypothetical protein Fur0020_13100 [Thermodesulfovibrionia bacterium]
MNNKLYIIGIGFRPIDKRARGVILDAVHLLVNDRLLEVFRGYDEYEKVKERIKVINNVDETMEFMKAEVQKGSGSIVLIAEGDPMFFGIGRRVIDEFGKDGVEIYPDLSSMQVAFSRIKETWSDAFLISLHGGPDPEKRRRLPYEIKDIPYLLQSHNKVAILTDKENSPSAIAKGLLNPSVFRLQPSALKIYVCERLGYPDERLYEGSPDEIAGMSFSTPNVVIIMRH